MFTASPSPSPHDDAAWSGVQIVSGGLGRLGTTLDRDLLREHWRSQGVSDDAITYFLEHPPSPNTLYVGVDTITFTERACDDAERAQGSHEATPLYQDCRTCKYATPGKPQFKDPDHFCEPFSRSDKRWMAARKWLGNAAPEGRLRASSDCPEWAAKGD